MTVEVKEKPQSQDIPLETGQSSVDKITPKTYSESEFLKAVSDEKTISGRLKTDLGKVTSERDSFKSKVSELESIREEMTEKDALIERLSEGDTDKLTLVKLHKEARDLAREYKAKVQTLDADRQTLENDRQVHSERISRAEAFERSVKILEIADEYKDADIGKLTDLCDTLGAKTEEQIKKIADTLWAKKTAGSAETMTADSGVTSGGGQLTEEGKARKRYPTMFRK